MNKEVIELGRNYECRIKSFARPVIGEVVEKGDQGCVIHIERFYGLDVDKIDQNDGKMAVGYDEIAGPAINNCFYN